MIYIILEINRPRLSMHLGKLSKIDLRVSDDFKNIRRGPWISGPFYFIVIVRY